METDTTYNGWKNYETWNVVLWMNNDEFLYDLMVQYGHKKSYQDFVYDYLLEHMQATPDGVGFLDRNLDWDALDEMVRENSDTDSFE